MARILGIDYGSKRIGLAICDPDEIIATPMEIIAGTGSPAEDAVNITARARELDVVAMVIGLPLNMSGSEGDQARITRVIGEKLAEVSSLPVHYVDERLTSFAADSMLRQADMDRLERRKRRDKVAASLILQAFLDSRRADEQANPKVETGEYPESHQSAGDDES